MKYLLVFAVVMVGFWLWRNNRRTNKAEMTGQTPSFKPQRSQNGLAVPTPQPMLQCAVCGVHLPQSDAQLGERGVYCGVAHRKQVEG